VAGVGDGEQVVALAHLGQPELETALEEGDLRSGNEKG